MGVRTVTQWIVVQWTVVQWTVAQWTISWRTEDSDSSHNENVHILSVAKMVSMRKLEKQELIILHFMVRVKYYDS